MQKICVALKFHFGDTALVDEIVSKLPKPPDDIWKEFRSEKTNGFSYNKEFPDLRLIDEDELLPWFNKIIDIIKEVFLTIDASMRSELAITIYTKDNATVNIPLSLISRLDALDCDLNVSVFNVEE